jgi:hypothetical protein
MVTLNLRHAINDYGILDSNLPTQVLAQTNNSGGGTSNDGGDSSGGGGTKRGWCYINQPFAQEAPSWRKECNQSTNDSEIFPCPTSDSYKVFLDVARDSCTK